MLVDRKHPCCETLLTEVRLGPGTVSLGTWMCWYAGHDTQGTMVETHSHTQGVGGQCGHNTVQYSIGLVKNYYLHFN